MLQFDIRFYRQIIIIIIFFDFSNYTKMIRIFLSINIYIYIHPIVRFRFVPYFSPKLWFATVPRVLCITRMESRGVTKAVHKYEIAAERCYATAVRYFYRPPFSFSPSRKAKNWCSTPGGSIQIFARLDRASNDNVLIRNFPQSVRRDNKGRDAFYETLI